jgi:hypothetical protein
MPISKNGAKFPTELQKESGIRFQKDWSQRARKIKNMKIALKNKMGRETKVKPRNTCGKIQSKNQQNENISSHYRMEEVWINRRGIGAEVFRCDLLFPPEEPF